MAVTISHVLAQWDYDDDVTLEKIIMEGVVMLYHESIIRSSQKDYRRMRRSKGHARRSYVILN